MLMEATEEKLSRRNFLKSATTLATGLAVGGVVGSGLFAGGCASNGATKTAVAAKWPWPYQKLDPEVVRKKGYEGYYEGACMYGAVRALVSELSAKVGDPYSSLPIDMFRYGEGGMAGWGSLCGALNGSCAVLNLASDKNTYPKLVTELLNFYTTNSFPSKKHDAYAKFPGQVQSVSGSTLCHVSIANWCKVSGKKALSPERADRCAKLAGDVAAHAAELLNKVADGTFAAAYTIPPAVQTCRGCHAKGGTLGNIRGKENCEQCHDLNYKAHHPSF